MRLFSVIFFTVFALMTTSASGTEKAFSDADYDRCLQRATSTSAFSTCGRELLNQEDNKLNRVWKHVFATTSGKTKIDLLAEQRLWISFKEKSCTFFANGEWGREGQVLKFVRCRANILAERSRALEVYRQSFSGDL